MASNPLSYDGFKAVLQYMEANLRDQLSSRIPSIRVIEKLVPMRFDSISFNEFQTKVNDTTYRLGVYREYPEGYGIPKNHREENEKGGVQSDLTEHGFRIRYARLPMTPGDVDIPIPERQVFPGLLQDRVFDVDQLSLERQLEIYERALETRVERGDDAVLGVGNGHPDLLNFGLRIVDIHPEQMARIERSIMDGILPLSAERLREEIHILRANLSPYYCRRDNIPRPYTAIVQLTVESPGGKDIYRHPYTIRLEEAMKTVNTKLFGARDCVHQLRALSINEQYMVIRLPESFRVRLRELSVTGDLILNHTALQSIVDESSYPLDVLGITQNVHELMTYNNEVVKNAKQLIISPRLDMPMFSCFPILLTLENQSVKLRRVFMEFSVQEQVRLMEKWIDDGKEVGTTLSYQVFGERFVDYLLQQITFRFVGSRLGRRVMMPMNNGNRLEIQCIRLVNPLNENTRERWEVTMRVVAGQEGNDN